MAKNVQISDQLWERLKEAAALHKLGLGEQWNRKYGRRLDLGPPE
jgi:hypothetical protein